MHNGREGQKGSRDPQYLSPHTIILEWAFVEYWQDVTDKVRLPQGSQWQEGQSSHSKNRAGEQPLQGADESLEDMVEHGLPGPNSMYDTCGQSFIAADGDHAKASTHMFEDTGVMAMLCCHDIPLFLVNMWTPGEK